jgi:hypothetical protein
MLECRLWTTLGDRFGSTWLDDRHCSGAVEHPDQGAVSIGRRGPAARRSPRDVLDCGEIQPSFSDSLSTFWPTLTIFSAS